MNPVIFISHSTSDKAIANILRDYLITIGINNDLIFCSSLPSNGVDENISVEVRENLKNSQVNIALLSNNYYGSPYCLNEAGIIWFNNKPTIVIGLPEITHKNMKGFLDSQYILRRLDNNNDLSNIYDRIQEILKFDKPRTATINEAINKAIVCYTHAISTRKTDETEKNVTVSPTHLCSHITTDDEKIVLYYILDNKIRKVSKYNVEKWLEQNEIYDVNIDNAFDLLSSVADGKTENGTLELDISFFRDLTTNDIPDSLKQIVKKHTSLSSETFKKLHSNGELEDIYLLFSSYIIDEKEEKFGSAWKAKEQVDRIREWEGKCSLYSSLSLYYSKCINFFNDMKLVYASEWTENGNVREYTLCPSIKDYLFNHNEDLFEDILKVKKKNYCELPF